MVRFEEVKLVKEFLDKREISFVLTGTAALDIHGLVPENYTVNDIDIIVPVSEDTHQAIRSMLLDLEKLTGGNGICGHKENYTDECFTLFVGPTHTKVNAILRHIESCEMPTYLELAFGDKARTLNLHSVDEILKAKFKLQRPKDYKFCNDLATTLFTYFKK